EGKLTIKGLSMGAARAEYEYTIPALEAAEMLETLCLRPIVEKTRYCVEYGGLTFEVDEFGADNEGLVVAEVELDTEDQPISLPDWIGDEVTHDPRYYNANLIAHPFNT